MSRIRNGSNECQILRQQTDYTVTKDELENIIKTRIPSKEEWDNSDSKTEECDVLIYTLQ